MCAYMVKTEMDIQVLNSFVEAEGGVTAAAIRIAETLGCSTSKAEKLAAGRYPSQLSLSEQIALARLFKTSRERAFKVSKRAS